MNTVWGLYWDTLFNTSIRDLEEVREFALIAFKEIQSESWDFIYVLGGSHDLPGESPEQHAWSQQQDYRPPQVLPNLKYSESLCL